MKSAINGARLSVLSIALLGGLSAYGQSAPSGVLKEVVVVASRFAESKLDVPVSVQVISKADIANSAARSVPDVLRMLGGVNVRDAVGGQLGLNSAVDLGGFGATATQNTLVLVDGHRLNPIDSSEIDWSVVPLSSIERIEVTAGGAGVQFGAGATGGVVYITTNGNTTERSQAGVSVGSFGTAQLSLQLDRQFDALALSLNATADHSDGWRENAQADAQHVSAKVKKNLGALGHVFGELVLSQGSTALAGGVAGQVGSGDMRAVKFNNVGSDNSVNQQGLRFGGLANVSAQTSLDVDVFVGKKSSHLVRPYYDTPAYWAGAFAFPSVDSIKLDGEELSVSPKFRTEYANGTQLVYGFDLSQSKQNGQGDYGALAQQYILANQYPGGYQGNLLSDQQSVQLRNQSLYLIARVPLNQAVEFSAGARRQLQSFDSYDLNKSVGYAQAASGIQAANAYEVGVNFKLSDTSRTYLRVNQSYRFANTDEYWGIDPVSFNRVFSGELHPQTTKAYELGYDFKNASQQFSAVIGQSRTQDEIRYDAAVFKNRNLLDDIGRTSLVLNWSAQVLDKSHVTLGARLQRAEYATGAYSGQMLGMVPSATLNAGWIQDLADGNKVGMQLTHVAKQNYDAAPSTLPTLEPMPAYTTADVFWARKYGKLQTKLTLKNIADVSYAPYGGYSFVTTPGGGGNNYYYYPSDPRSVHLSMNYSF